MVLQILRPVGGSAASLTYAHGRKASPLHLLLQELQPERQPEEAPTHPHGGEALQLPILWPDIQRRRHHEEAQAHSLGRAAVPMLAVLEDIHLGQRAAGALKERHVLRGQSVSGRFGGASGWTVTDGVAVSWQLHNCIEMIHVFMFVYLYIFVVFL